MEHCQFFLEKKKRHCRMSVKKGKRYCGEHQSYGDELNRVIDERIPCPLDSSHTCFQSKLSKHLKVCNAKIKQDMQPPYVVKGINLGDNGEEINDLPLSAIDREKIDAVLSKIKNSYDKLPEIPVEIREHEALKEELQNPIYGPEGKRHLLQTASLLGHMENADLVHKNTCFIEFGAGRGKLTYWLAQTIKSQVGSSILLVDRSSHRHKRENKLKDEPYDIKVVRIRADIADLKLNDVPEVETTECKVAIAKHICGAATDLTLRCMINSIDNRQNSKIGIVIAFCCHHRCEYSHYVGHKYLEAEGFTRDDFPILCKIASWATCGIKQSSVCDNSEKEAMGQKVKILLNWGRLEYLKMFGFNCRLVYYTTMDTTPENTCIVGSLIKEGARTDS